LAAVLAVLLCLCAAAPAHAFDLFARHEVTTHFATQDGKPMAHTLVRVFAPGDSTKPTLTGYTDAQGKFTFTANRDGFWSAEAQSAGEVARIMIRVGGTATPQHSRLSPFIVIGALAVLLALAFWYRLLRARSRR
jgi:hypothetical protein